MKVGQEPLKKDMLSKSRLFIEAHFIAPSMFHLPELANTFSESEFHIKKLFLLATHQPYTPAELVWTKVKTAVGAHTIDFNLNDVESIANETTGNIILTVHCSRLEN